MRDRATPHQAQTAQMDQQVYFTSSIDGVRVAYATAGSGPPLVKTANYLSHLEFDWESPVWRHWLTELSRDHMLIRYDERGTGLSDWVVEDLSFASWVNDLEAVVDALGLERFPLLGLSQGGPVALAYAVRHPEKVSHLILFGSYARGWLHRNLTDNKREEERIMIDLMRVGWGRDNPAFSRVLSTQIMPEASSEQMRALDELARISATPENAVKLEMEMHRIDVQALAAQVRVPTLVIHPKGDGAVPFDEGRYLASLIPRARFVTLESRNHILLAQEPAWEKFVTTLRHFLAT
jgi:pimeloyl-ACP methyl ester carboxylesterase